jgi:hypothetical protein
MRGDAKARNRVEEVGRRRDGDNERGESDIPRTEIPSEIYSQGSLI